MDENQLSFHAGQDNSPDEVALKKNKHDQDRHDRKCRSGCNRRPVRRPVTGEHGKADRYGHLFQFTQVQQRAEEVIPTTDECKQHHRQ